MFGFPFVTSLIVVTGLVTALSFIINKGTTLSPKTNQLNLEAEANKSTHTPA